MDFDKKHMEKGKTDIRILSTRHFQCFLMFLGIGISAALRLTLSVAIVSMTDQKSTNLNNNTIVYNWTEQIKSLLLSGYSWGSLISQIPGGQLSKKYGSKYIFLIGILFSSIMSLTVPIVTYYGNWKALLACRAIEGFFNGFCLPSLYTLLAQWSPEKERGHLCLFTISGMNIMSTIMLATSGQISYNLGWQLIFYIWGSLGILWSIIWISYGSNSPKDNINISDEEKKYIMDNIKTIINNNDNYYIPTPWSKIFQSIPFYAVLISQCCGTLAFQMTVLNVPRYLNGVYHFSIQNSGLFSSLTHFVRWLSIFIFITINYYINRYKNLSLDWNRKLFNTIGQWGPIFGFLGLSFVTKEYIPILIICLISIPFFNAASGLGNDVNHIDMAPNHAGTLLGICNFIMGIVTIAGTNFVGLIVTDAENQQEWQIIFLLASGAIFLGGLVFLLFSSTDVQDWNNLKAVSDISA